MKLISLNTWGGQLKEDFDAFIKQYRNDVDVFCLQEVFHEAYNVRPSLGPVRPNLFVELKALLPDHQAFYASSQDNDEGLALFARNSIRIDVFGDIFVHRHLNAMVGDDGATIGRNIQYVKFKYLNDPCTIINFHGLWNGRGKTDAPDRIKQSRKVCQFMDVTKGKKILCGDFNLLPNTESIAMLEKGMKNLVKEYGITSTRSHHYTKEHKFADYIIVSTDIKVANFEVLQEPVSDHLPLLLEF